MRVISGSARGLKLSSPIGIDTRPTLDRVKEAVFSILCEHITDGNVLDLFSGTGALGIEALSRGAKRAVFVDDSDIAIDCIKENLLRSRLVDKSRVEKNDYLRYLKGCTERFDLIFLDPPYSKGFYESALDIIGKKQLLTDDGLIVVEWDYEIGFTNNLHSFKLFKEKKYGRVGITVLEWSFHNEYSNSSGKF